MVLLVIGSIYDKVNFGVGGHRLSTGKGNTLSKNEAAFQYSTFFLFGLFLYFVDWHWEKEKKKLLDKLLKLQNVNVGTPMIQMLIDALQFSLFKYTPYDEHPFVKVLICIHKLLLLLTNILIAFGFVIGSFGSSNAINS